MDCFAFVLGLGGFDSPPETVVFEKLSALDGAPKVDTTEPLLHIEPEMILVQGAKFLMGATPEQGDDGSCSEKSVHPVMVRDFYIGKYEVTQAQWKAVMGNNPSRNQGDNLPVEKVSWEDVQAFINKLNSQTGKTYRLPTEAEWEFAARGGKGYKYSGSNVLDDVAWHKANSGDKTHTVGTKAPNELGIYDMCGNIQEWCSDWYDVYNKKAQTNPQGPSSGTVRVCRGDYYNDSKDWCCVSSRYKESPDSSSSSLGFRLAL